MPNNNNNRYQIYLCVLPLLCARIFLKHTARFTNTTMQLSKFMRCPQSANILVRLLQPGVRFNSKKHRCDVIKSGDLSSAIHLLRRGAKFTSKDADTAALYGHLEIIKVLHTHGVQCTNDAMVYAMSKNHLEIAIFIHEHQFPCEGGHLARARMEGNENIVKYFEGLGIECLNMIQVIVNYISMLTPHPLSGLRFGP